MTGSLTRLTCPSCAEPLRADDLRPDQGVAACHACRAVFRLGGTTPRPPVPCPPSVTQSESAARLRLQRRWWQWKYLFFVLFCAMWFGFLAVWYAIVLTTDAPMMFRLFPLIHVAAGLGIAYFTLAGFVNTTTVELDRGYLSVRHGPLPWPGGGEIGTSTIQQLYCTRHESRNKNGISYTYRLYARMSDGKQRKLLSGLDSPEVPLYLEQQLEAFLRIPDEAVDGELAR